MEPSSPIHEALRTIPEPAALLEAFFARAPVALQVYRADGHCLLTNDAFRDLFAAVPPSEYNVLEDELLEKQGVLPAIRRAFGGEPVTIEPFWYDPRDLKKVDVAGGRRVAAGAHLFPIKDASGNIAYVALIFKDVTDELLAREAAEHAAASAERGRAEIEAILLNLPAGVVIAEAPSGRLVRANAYFERILGGPFVPVADVSGYDRYPIEHADGRPFAPEERPLVRSLTSGEVVTGQESVFVRPDGHRIWLRASSAPIRDREGRITAAVAIFLDVTEQKRVEHELRQSEERFRAVFQHSGLGVLVAGLDGTMRQARVNPTFEKLLGYSEEEIRALGVRGVTHPDDYRSDLERFHALLMGELESYELDKRYIRKDGSTLHGRLVVTLGRDALEEPQFVIAMIQDITARKVAELERERLLEELRASVKARDDFLSMASHELRTPLTTLALGVDVLQSLGDEQGPSGSVAVSDFAPRVAALRRQLNRIERLIDGLLDVSRIATGGLKMNPEEVDMASIARDVVARFGDDAARAGSTVALDAPSAVVGTWDPLRLDQIVTNLVSNAIKYGLGKPITVTVAADDARARLSVRDGGMGISREDYERIFERFERAASQRRFGGIGLGLWIVRQIVDAMGGRITVEGRPGEGSLFVVELPRAIAATPPV